MSCVPGKAKCRLVGREQSVGRSGYDSSCAAKQSASQKINEYQRQAIDQEHPKMDALRRLAKDRHYYGVSRIRSRQLHVVGKFVRRYVLQHELPGIGVFAFVPFQRHSARVATGSSRTEQLIKA